MPPENGTCALCDSDQQSVPSPVYRVISGGLKGLNQVRQIATYIFRLSLIEMLLQVEWLKATHLVDDSFHLEDPSNLMACEYCTLGWTPG